MIYLDYLLNNYIKNLKKMNGNENYLFDENKIEILFLVKKLLCIPSLSLLFNFFIWKIVKKEVFTNNSKIFNIIICFSSILQTLSNFFHPNHSFFNIDCLYTNLINYVFQIEIILLIIFFNIFSISIISLKTVNRFMLCIISLLLGIGYLIM